MQRRKRGKYSDSMDQAEDVTDVGAKACRPDNDDVTRGSSFLPVYQPKLYWNCSNIQDQVSVCVHVCVCVCESCSALQSNNERLTESQPGHNNVQKIEFSTMDRHTKTADWICDLSYPHTHTHIQ